MRRLACLTVFLALLLPVAPARAQTGEIQELVDRAKTTVDRLRKDQNMGKPIADMLAKAKAVLVVPNLWRAGFILGGAGGTALLMAKGSDGSWSAPSFYGMGAGSIGFQIGAEMQEIMLIVLTDGGLAKIMDNQIKLGADLTFALGPVGAGIGGATTPNFEGDIVAYSTSIGLYGGLNLEGALMSVREEWNRLYYGEGATSREIVINRRFNNPGTAALRATLGEATGR